MIFTIYDPPDSSNSKTWGELCVGAIVDVSSWEYEGQFCGVGTFELVVPVGAEGVDKLKLDRFLMCGDGGFIIKQLEFSAEEVQVSGYDLNGLLLGRLTITKTEDGKDKQSGSTEAIVKHYVEANCVSSDDAGRNFPGFVVAANQNRGIANDAASPRLQVVGDVISDILSAQKMGWRITAIGTEAGYTGGEKFSFDIISAIDRTWNQTANDSVSFSYGLGTVNSMKSEQSSADARNTLYCELSDGTVQTYSPTDGNSGYARTEDFAALNCDLSELSIYADHEIADRFAAINNVTIEHIDPSQWGTKIHLGDIVTVYDKHIGLNSNDHTLEALITAVKVKRANGESEISITIGGTRPKLIDRVSKDVSEVSKNVGDVSSKTKETITQFPVQEQQINELDQRVTAIEKGGGGGGQRDRIIASNGNAWVATSAHSGEGGGFVCFDTTNDNVAEINLYHALHPYKYDESPRYEGTIQIAANKALTLQAQSKWGSASKQNINFNITGDYVGHGVGITADSLGGLTLSGSVPLPRATILPEASTLSLLLNISPEGKATITISEGDVVGSINTQKVFEIPITQIQ